MPKKSGSIVHVLKNISSSLSRSASTIMIQSLLLYSPLNSCSDGTNHRSLQGKLSSVIYEYGIM